MKNKKEQLPEKDIEQEELEIEQEELEIEQEELEIEQESSGGVENRESFWIAIFAIVGIFIGALFTGGFLQVILRDVVKLGAGISQFITYLLTFSVTIGFAIWILRSRGVKRPLLKWSIRRADPTLILWGLILIFATSIVIEPLVGLFPETNLDALAQIPSLGIWAMLTTILLAPILEEVLFRGIIQENVTREYGGIIGILFGSFVFSLAHVGIPQQAVVAFFSGIILGYIYMKTGSLLAVIVIHFLNNAIAYILMALLDKPRVAFREMVESDIIYYSLYGVCAAIFIFAVIKIVQQVRRVKARD